MVLGLGLRGDAHLTFPFEQYHHNGRYLWAKRWKASGGMQREHNILETHLHITDRRCQLLGSHPSSSTGQSRGGTPEPIASLLLHSNEDLPVLERVEPALHQDSPLDPKGSKEEIETHGSESITLEEHHEEAKAHKDHHMDVLESCAEGRDRQLCGYSRAVSAI